MFDWNHNGRRDSSDSFMDFMIFNEVMKNEKNSETGKKESPQRGWIDELEELDAMDDEDE